MLERAGLFEDDDFDVSVFKPKPPQQKEQPQPEAVRSVAETANFRSREPGISKTVKADRRHRTGRNLQLNTKVDQRTNDLLYAIYDAHRNTDNWTLGQIIGLALEALQRELEAKPLE